jgi:hypothetical protein
MFSACGSLPEICVSGRVALILENPKGKILGCSSQVVEDAASDDHGEHCDFDCKAYKDEDNAHCLFQKVFPC